MVTWDIFRIFNYPRLRWPKRVKGPRVCPHKLPAVMSTVKGNTMSRARYKLNVSIVLMETYGKNVYNLRNRPFWLAIEDAWKKDIPCSECAVNVLHFLQ